MEHERSEDIYGLGAEFDSIHKLMAAAKELSKLGYTQWEVYSPFPIHGIAHVRRLGKSKVSLFSLVGGLIGLSIALVMVTAISAPRPSFFKEVLSSHLQGLFYPLVVQGKPYLGFQAFVPVLIEMTILFASFSTVIGVFFFNRMPSPYKSVWNWERLSQKAMDDRFFLVVEKSDPHFSEDKTKLILKELGAQAVVSIRR
ncbi:DUF3341 domain-containing protein [Candidatus Methylacidiphilum fumarolicum]|uniref:DUF3341 domain-containing protein n=2 Tax=Candidatus Methylacidiphilum fumarolicum TaxID=591154 RepID=I0JZ57_METFB|nr:DUF3341 domain-containing protein [Candidatus Methylacidiphilum fumarolicum]MBW6414682.1 DUF3341 domain-containing protein [Candidatus Methylacidiphilum fumarolicum]TFE70180.1 hypothetical protein A7K73_04710 [Candidatus Methylacidiphilum fumarolicum]TFE74253.1 DUF3341 domain-containing protein [Candidatus Methylacidiphilum fumarolicum]TFE75752.1 DUF3341 domain-containing protein [Candidatus Methylacidiphilum fumarolicum]TFE75911.1 hypothetical protein A7D33_01250 [Candidatus Methylacidiphi